MTDNPRQAANPPAPVISQSLLAEYRKLTRLQDERKKLREEILALIERQAIVEPGALTARIREVPSRTFSTGKLCAVLGEQQVEELKQQVELTISRHLIVTDRQSAEDSREQSSSASSLIDP